MMPRLTTNPPKTFNIVYTDGEVQLNEHLPSLHMSSWLTAILVDLSLKQLSNCTNDKTAMKVLEETLLHWSVALRSPSSAVRLCGIRTIS